MFKTNDQRNKKKLYLALMIIPVFLLVSWPAHASDWVTCKWAVTIQEVNDETASFYLEQLVDSNSLAGPDDTRCQKAFSDNPTDVALDKIDSGKKLLAPEARFRATWRHFNGMGPDGVIVSEGWALLPVKIK